jgi:hypothetical protein
MNDTNPSVDAFAREMESSLRTLVSPHLESLFWTPELLGKPSAWWGHVPFTFWVMSVGRPRVFVELGSHHGVSYAGFCERATSTLAIPTRPSITNSRSSTIAGMRPLQSC